MVSSTTRKTFSFAISLLVAVISLTTAAQAANAPTAVTSLDRYTPGFAGNPGKMVRDTAGNFYVADFWGKRIVKLNNQGGGVKYIPTAGRPSAVYPLPDGRLVVAMAVPQKYVAFYSQAGDELAQFGASAYPYFRPVAITRDKSGNIYVLDSGDISDTDLVNNVPRVIVYDAAGVYKYGFGAKTISYNTSTTAGTFKQPMGIAYEKASDRIVVVDTLNGRIQFFQPYDVSATCAPDATKTFGGTAGRTAAALNVSAKFYNPVDIAFEYNGAALNRMFVLERGHNEVAAVDGVTGASYGYYRKAINLANYPAIGKDLVQPTSLAFANKISAGAAVPGGVLYVNNAKSSAPADIFVMGVEGGTVPSPGVTLGITTAIPASTPSSSLPISGTVSPANAVFCSVNGGADQSAGSGWSTTLTLASGYNHIVCKSTLSDVTAYVEADTYYAGTVPTPTVNVVAPGAGLYTKNNTVTVSGTSDTANATVRLTNALNGQMVETTTGSDVSHSWSATVTLADGSNDITPTIWKVGTNVGTAAPVTVVADFVAPTVTLGFLANSRVTGSAVQNLDGIVNKAVANITSLEVNGIDVPATSMLSTADNKTYFSVPVTLNRGSNNVVVNATDKAGRLATATRTTVTLDPDLPAFSVELPADNSYMTVAAPSSGTADPVYTSVNAAGQNTTPSGGIWNASAFTLGAGFNAYEFTASGGGKSATEKRTVINDAAYAKLAITSPAADLATKNASVLIQGSVAPLSPTPTITVDDGATINVTTYDSNTGNFSHTVALATQGAHTVKVAANAATTAVRNIIYDTVAPDFSLQADSKPAPTTISGALEPSAKITTITASLFGVPVDIPLSRITYDAYDAATDSVVWHANLSGYAYDVISFTALDPAGNSAQLAYSAVVPTGDIDGDGSVRLADALSALRHVAGTQVLIGDQFVQGDVGDLVGNRAGRNGKIDITDATLILKKSYNLLSF